MHLYETTIDREDCEIHVSVWYHVTPAERGLREKYGVPLEPDYPEEILLEMVAAGGVEIDTSETENRRLREEIASHA